MRTYDLAPLFRSTVGFDRMAQLLDAATRVDDTSVSYPPYNIEKLGENSYRIVMAVAGFGPDELDITVKESSLVVTGKAKEEEKSLSFLHRGIARRAFERRFQLADHIKVTGANLNNGLLEVELLREIPEALKPRTVQISVGSEAQGRPVRPTIDHKAA